MNRLPSALAILSLLCCLAPGLRAADPPSAPCDCQSGGPCDCGPGCKCDLSASVVEVFRVTADGRQFGGSGVVVAVEGGNALVLTNRHVAPAEPGDRYIVYRHGRHQERLAVYVGRAERADLAALAVRARSSSADEPDELKAAPPAAAAPAVGEAVTQAGHPRLPGAPSVTAEPLVRRGAFGGVTCFLSDTGVPNASARLETHEGDSGSGIFNARGELVAVVWGGGGPALAVPLEEVQSFCRSKCAGQFPEFAKACPQGARTARVAGYDRNAVRAVAAGAPQGPVYQGGCPGGCCGGGCAMPMGPVMMIGGCPGGSCGKR